MLKPNTPTKSSFSVQNCLVATVDDNGDVIIENSRLAGPQIRYSAAEWVAFVKGVKAAEFDHPAAI